MIGSPTSCDGSTCSITEFARRFKLLRRSEVALVFRAQRKRPPEANSGGRLFPPRDADQRQEASRCDRKRRNPCFSGVSHPSTLEQPIPPSRQEATDCDR